MEEVTEQSGETGFTMDNPWPFQQKLPSNEDLNNLLAHLVEIDGHVFYVWHGERRRHLRVDGYKEGHAAKRIVWWIAGRRFPQGSGLTTNCGEQKCIKLDHLKLSWPNTPYGPDLPPKPPAPPLKASQKPVEEKSPEPEVDWEKGDRTKCWTSKVHYSSKRKAREAAKRLNTVRPPGMKARKLSIYDCPYCDGHHLTKRSEKEYIKRKPKGSWR
ncbi:hypothetical protein SEA_ATUIN_210 [Arthrobacter phage Atuin]|nr:hypothetical protein SEA_ATUIN_9 [Arthrobacter phage Atuin]